MAPSTDTPTSESSVLTATQANPNWLQVARALFDEYDWRLADAVTLADEAERKHGDIETSPRRALIRDYYARVHAACADETRPQRRERAFTELGQMLYRVAHNAYGDSAADVSEIVNAALATIWEQLPKVRWPETFLDFALYKLKAAATNEWRFQHHNTRRFQVHTFAALAGNDGDSAAEAGNEDSVAEALPSDDDEPLDIVQRGECAHALMAAIEQLKNPNQREVLLLGMLDGLGDAEIAQRLSLSMSNVRKLRFDAHQKLRQNSKLMECHA